MENTCTPRVDSPPQGKNLHLSHESHEQSLEISVQPPACYQVLCEDRVRTFMAEEKYLVRGTLHDMHDTCQHCSKLKVRTLVIATHVFRYCERFEPPSNTNF